MDTKTDSVRRGNLEGRVLRKDGSAVADVSIAVARAPGPQPDIAPVTDADGRFSLSDLLPGEWVFDALGPDGERGQGSVTVEAGVTASIPIYVA